MRFLNDLQPTHDLTYSEVFLVPRYSDVESRFEVDLTPTDNSGAKIPLIVANMNAVAGKRMSETVARRGGLTVLPQDIPLDVLEPIIKYVKSRHTLYETPLTLQPDNTIIEALSIIKKRSHGGIIVTNAKNEPVGIFTEDDAVGHDRFTPLSLVMTKSLVSVPEGLKPEKIFDILHQNRVHMAPVVKRKKVVGVVTQKGVVRSDIYSPAVDINNKLLVAAALGINNDPKDKAKKFLEIGVDILVLDTAHGHQSKMINAIKSVRSLGKKVPIVAGNVASAEGTRELIRAGANIVKVGVGPGAMCTTRVMTGVGRPQFSNVLECAAAAKALGAKIWADGGARYPRDVAMALAAGASNVMIGTWFAGTYESPGDVLTDTDGRLFKENFGMASKRAVKGRTKSSSAFQQSKSEFFEEGISTSKLYINEEEPGVEDVIDSITAGVRSAIAYTGARNITEFQEKATFGVQSIAGFQEGMAISTNW